MKNCVIVFLAAAMLSATAVSLSLAAPASAAAGEVVIINTGDRLTPGYQVTVEPSGKISGSLTPRRGQKTIQRTDHLIAPVRHRFFADLASTEPLDALPIGVNAPAASTGRNGRQRRTMGTTRTVSGAAIFVRYQGKQSPNLRDASSSAGKTLLQDVKQIIQLLRFPVPERP